MSSRSVTILGAGLSGLAAAQRLREAGCQVDVYEKNLYVGGHAYSHCVSGFIFDEGPHVSFTKRPEIIHLLEKAVNYEYVELDAQVFNYWQGHAVRHPAQCNLFGLPVDVVERCIVDFVKAKQKPDQAVTNYAEWCYRDLGRTFSDEFTFRYTRKYWAIEPRQMSIDWVGTRVYSPSLEEIIRGALAPQSQNFHYITHFRYPASGGFGAYVQAVASDARIHTDCEVALIDARRQELEFVSGKKVHYERLISSMPLPDLIQRIKDVPLSVLEASRELAYTSLVLVNVGLGRDVGYPDMHWMYFYDDDMIITRGNLPHRLSSNNVPAGCGSLQMEIYYSKYRPLECSDVLTRAIDDMRRVGLILPEDDIKIAFEQRIPYANVLFDLQRAKSIAIIQAYLSNLGIRGCGRYGEWAYYWSDDSLISGWRVAERTLQSAS